MNDFSLYVILDKKTCLEADLAKAARQLIEGGADVIQLRDKVSDDKIFFAEAIKIRGITKAHKIPFIINDRLDLALAVCADGIHLGQDDLDITIARRLFGADKIIGRSTHNLAQALEAEKEGADYIGLGPVFSTPTKPDYQAVSLDLIKEVKGKIKIPFVAIGGIDQGNIREVLSAGARNIAVVRAVIGQKDIKTAVRNLKNIILEYKNDYDLIRVG